MEMRSSKVRQGEVSVHVLRVMLAKPSVTAMKVAQNV